MHRKWGCNQEQLLTPEETPLEQGTFHKSEDHDKLVGG